VSGLVRETVASEPENFVLTSGHCVWEIRPRVSWHKGEAIRWLAGHLAASAAPLVFYLGDDRTDEDAFACLPGAMTARIGDRTVPTAARYWLPDPQAVFVFLDWLARSSPLSTRATRKYR
jgi:trehalose-phosphatase